MPLRKPSSAIVFVSGRYLPPPYRVYERGVTVAINKTRVFTAEEPERPDGLTGREAFIVNLLDQYLARAARGGTAYALEKLQRELCAWPDLTSFTLRSGAVDLRFKNGAEEELILPVLGPSRPSSAKAQARRFAKRLREAIERAAIVLIGEGYFAVTRGTKAGPSRDRLIDLARARRLPSETKVLEIAGLKTLATGLRERR